MAILYNPALKATESIRQRVTQPSGGMSASTFALNGQLLGQKDGYTYTKVPKADGGFDYYRVGGSRGEDVWSIKDTDVPQQLQGAILGDTTGLPETTAPGTVGSGGIDLVKLQEDYNRQLRQAEIDKTYADMEFANKGTAITQAKDTTKEGAVQAVDQNNAYFAQASPDAYQSQVENYNTKIKTGYEKAMQDLGSQEQQLAQKKQLYDETYNMQLAQMASDLQSQKSTSYGTQGTGAEYIDPLSIINDLVPFYAEATARFGPQVAQSLVSKQVGKMKIDPASKEYYSNVSNLQKWLDQNNEANLGK